MERQARQVVGHEEKYILRPARLEACKIIQARTIGSEVYREAGEIMATYDDIITMISNPDPFGGVL